MKVSRNSSMMYGGISTPTWLARVVAILLVVLSLYATGEDRDIAGKTTPNLPDVGTSYSDSKYKTAIKRITNAVATPDLADAGMLTFITQEYSTISPFNKGGSRLLLQHGSYFAMYDGEGNYLKSLPFAINASSEPRWSVSDPDRFYYITDNQLRVFNVGASSGSVIHTFTEYSRISGNGESDISADGDHFVLTGNASEIFVYTLSTDTKGTVLKAGAAGLFDNLQITPDNNVLVSWYQSGTKRFNGIELYNRNMDFIRQISGYQGHAEVTRDSGGQEILLLANAADPLAPASCQNGIVKITLATGMQHCLLVLDWSLAMHISAADQMEWFIVSTYAYKNPGAVQNWPTYTNEILQVRLDGTGVSGLVQHRSLPLNEYYYQPRAALSRDGTRLVFSSNQGRSSARTYPQNHTDVYLINPPHIAGSNRLTDTAPNGHR